MRKPSTTTLSKPKADWSVYFGISFLCPLLTFYVLYLTVDYLAFFRFFPDPAFWSQSMLKTNVVCYGPALLLFNVLGNSQLYCPHLISGTFAQRAIAFVGWLTLALILAGNTLLLLLHFSFFSADRYIRCWEPFPWGTWYYARTADICQQHGMAPVQFLNAHSNAKNAAKR